MLNAPILDVAIGLVFVFLLYSLLATSVNEFLATALSLRARMLRKAIAQKMLSNTNQQNKIASLIKGFVEFFEEFIYIFTGGPEKKGNEKNIGDIFYTHPIIKNYGSSSFFKIPSYLAASNFAIIITESLKEDFNYKIKDIAFQKNTTNLPLQQVIDELANSADIIKIKELFDYYAWFYAVNPQKKIYDAVPELPRGLDKETHCILQLHLRNSLFDYNQFMRRIEGWYNDTMDRVSGWYKRQTQFILFVLGILLAIGFNVDAIEISNRLSTDKDARNQVVQLAIDASNSYKDDPRVQRPPTNATDTLLQDSLLKQSHKYLSDTKQTLDSGIKNPNQVLGLGWGDYGEGERGFIEHLSKKTFHKFLFFGKINLPNSLKAVRKHVLEDSVSQALQITKARLNANPNATATPQRVFTNVDSVTLSRFYNQQKTNYPIRVKTDYIFYEIGTKKLLGFLITAFAISLGAPFWFDLLNKLVKLRGAGKKNDASDDVELPATKSTSSSPVNNIITPNTSEEAVG